MELGHSCERRTINDELDIIRSIYIMYVTNIYYKSCLIVL